MWHVRIKIIQLCSLITFHSSHFYTCASAKRNCLKSIILIPYHQLLLKTSPCPALPSLPSFFHTSSQPASSAKKILPTSFQAIVPVSSVQFSCSVMSDSLRPHEPQHARPPCPSPTPRVCSNLYPLSKWCYLSSSSSNCPFFFCLQFFLASESFSMSQIFKSDGQSIGASASTSVFPMNIQG